RLIQGGLHVLAAQHLRLVLIKCAARLGGSRQPATAPDSRRLRIERLAGPVGLLTADAGGGHGFCVGIALAAAHDSPRFCSCSMMASVPKAGSSVRPPVCGVSVEASARARVLRASKYSCTAFRA